MKAQKKRFSNNWNIPIDPSDKNYIQNEINYPHRNKVFTQALCNA